MIDLLPCRFELVDACNSGIVDCMLAVSRGGDGTIRFDDEDGMDL